MSVIKLEDIPKNPDLAVSALIDFFIDSKNYFYTRNKPNKTRLEELERLVEIFSVAVQLSRLSDDTKRFIEINIQDRISQIVQDANDFFTVINILARQIRSSKISDHFNVSCNPEFILDADEVTRISSLAAEMRDIVIASDFFLKTRRSGSLSELHKLNAKSTKKEEVLTSS